MFSRSILFFAVSVCLPLGSFACDIYKLKQILSSGGYVEVDNQCSSYDIRGLAAIGKDRVTVQLKGFSAYDARGFAQSGARLIASALDYSAYDMRGIADISKFLMTVDLAGYSAYDARGVAEKGVHFFLDNSFSAYDARGICQKVVRPATGSVFSRGFSESDLNQLSSAGCLIIPDEADLTFEKARAILRSGVFLEIGNQFSEYETKQLAEIGKYRLTVRLRGFSAYEARQIVAKGASFFVDSSFSAYDARQICKSKVDPATANALSAGFSDYDLRQIAESGCKIVLL